MCESGANPTQKPDITYQTVHDRRPERRRDPPLSWPGKARIASWIPIHSQLLNRPQSSSERPIRAFLPMVSKLTRVTSKMQIRAGGQGLESQCRLSGPLSAGSNAAAATNGGRADGPDRLIPAVGRMVSTAKATPTRPAQAFPTGRPRPVPAFSACYPPAGPRRRPNRDIRWANRPSEDNPVSPVRVVRPRPGDLGPVNSISV
jgi:hypothetical protein